MAVVRKVRVMINPNSGPISVLGRLYQVCEKHWNVDGIDMTYQISRSAEDGRAKVRRAMDDGVDTVIVAGGDGMVNSIGSELIGSDVALGVIPTGSGNGFARHFGISMNCEKAVVALLDAEVRSIDVGTLNGRPFFVTASMAWDAAMVEYIERSPVRGVLPYVFSAVYGYFDYTPQPVDLVFEDGEKMHMEKPLILTVANMTQFGGGAKIAPQAKADDGLLELVAISKSGKNVFSNLSRLFDGTLDSHESVTTRRFSHLTIERENPASVQTDGELLGAPSKIEITVLPRALNVLVPA